MKLSTTELRAFRAAAAAIPENNLLPILSYLKITPGSITKSSLNSFLTMAITSDSHFLIDEKTLMSAVAYTRAEHIDVRLEGNKVVMSDGSTVWSSPTDDAINFPGTEFPDGPGVAIPEAVLADIAVASSCNENDDLNAYRSHVFIANGLVAGTDGIIAYMRRQEGLPEIIISKPVASAIGRLSGVTFWENTAYQFYATGPYRYGFIKPTAAIINYNVFLVDLAGLPSITVQKADLVAFNDMAVSTSKMPNAFGTMRAAANVLHIDVVEANYEMGINKDMPCVGELAGSFGYNCGILNRLLKALPSAELQLTQAGTKMYITSSSHEFVSLIIQIGM